MMVRARTWPRWTILLVVSNRLFVPLLPSCLKRCNLMSRNGDIRRLLRIIAQSTLHPKLARRARGAIAQIVAPDTATTATVRTETTVTKLIPASIAEDVMAMMTAVVHKGPVSAFGTIFRSCGIYTRFFPLSLLFMLEIRSCCCPFCRSVLYLPENIFVAVIVCNAFECGTQPTSV
jgi:hypothetical protein